MKTPIDQLQIGQYVIQTEPVSYGARYRDRGIGTTVREDISDRSYMHRPFKVVGIELPYVILEPVEDISGYARRSMVDTRRFKLRVLSPEFVQTLLEKKS